MKDITDGKKTKPVEDGHVPYAGAICPGHVLENTSLKQNLTQHIDKPCARSIEPLIRLTQSQEIYEKYGSQGKGIYRCPYQC